MQPAEDLLFLSPSTSAPLPTLVIYLKKGGDLKKYVLPQFLS